MTSMYILYFFQIFLVLCLAVVSVWSHPVNVNLHLGASAAHPQQPFKLSVHPYSHFGDLYSDGSASGTYFYLGSNGYNRKINVVLHK